MQVDIQRGVERVQQLDDRARLRRFQFQIVAIEVDAVCGGIPAHLLRAAQCGADEWAALFVPIAVEDGDEHEIYLVQQIVLAALCNIAQQHQAGVLAIDLAAVDAGLCQHDRFAGLALARAHQQQIAPFAGLAEHLQRQQRRGGDQPMQPRTRLRVAGRADEIAALGRRDPRIVGRHDQCLACTVPHPDRRQRSTGIDGLRVELGGSEQRDGQHSGAASGAACGVAGLGMSGSVAVGDRESIGRIRAARCEGHVGYEGLEWWATVAACAGAGQPCRRRRLAGRSRRKALPQAQCAALSP